MVISTFPMNNSLGSPLLAANCINDGFSYQLFHYILPQKLDFELILQQRIISDHPDLSRRAFQR